MPRCLLFLAIALLAVSAAEPAKAVSGTLHINSGYDDVTSGLLPDKVVNFSASTAPQELAYQQDFSNTAEPPEVVFSRSAQAMMDGIDGELWGYVNVELNGIPPNNNVGIYAKAYLLGIDYFTLDSDVLDSGDPIDVTFRIDVVGNGPVDAQLQVFRIFTGGAQSGVLSLSYPNFASGTFSGLVGGLYKIEYHLQAYAGLTPFGMSEANPTRFLVSDYTMHVYGGTAQPAVVSIASNNGHDYTDPVPEPSAELLEASAVLTLAGRVHRRALKRRDVPSEPMG